MMLRYRRLLRRKTKGHPMRVYGIAAVSPLLRIRDMQTGEWLVSLLAGTVTLALKASTFAQLLALLVVSSMVDYVVGRRVAKIRGVYDPVMAHAGAVGKIVGVVLVFLVRGFEFAFVPYYDTRGVIATVLATGLFVVDLESIHFHRMQLGSKPIPGFAHIVRFIRGLSQKALPRDPGG